MKRIVKIALSNLAVLAALLFSADLITAITLRRSSFRSISPVYHHGFIPGASYDEEWTPGKRISEHINRHGMRRTKSDDLPYAATIASYKTVVMGDSFAEGVGVSYLNTIPSLLPLQYGPVANLGVRSHSPSLSLARLNYFAHKGLRPSYILHLVDASDLQDEYHYSSIEGFYSCEFTPICNPLQGLVENHIGRLVSVQLMFRAAWWLSSGRWGNPNPFSVWGGRTSYYHKRDPFVPMKAEYYEAGMKTLIKSILHIRSQFNSARYVIVLYPPSSLVLSGDLGNRYYRLFVDTIFAAFKSDPDVALCLVERPLIDGGSKLYIPGDSHWNELGHQVVARYIAERCLS